MKIDVKKIAKLSALSITSEETKNLEAQLADTLAYIENLESINTKGIMPTSQVTGLENITREDTVKPSLSQEEALANSKSTQNGFFKVKGILNNE